MDKMAVKQRLESYRDDLAARLQKIERHIHYPDEPLDRDFAEQAVELENRDVLHELQREALSELRQINAALDRLERGEYETCARCGGAIDLRRLDVLPYVAICIRCAEAG